MNIRLRDAFRKYEKSLRDTNAAISAIERECPILNDIHDKDNCWELRMHLNHNQFLTATEAIEIANRILKDNNMPPL